MAENTEEKTQGPYFHKERIKYSPEEEARLERQHFWRIIDAFRFYRYRRFRLKYRFVLCEEKTMLLAKNNKPQTSHVRAGDDRPNSFKHLLKFFCWL